MNELEKYIGRNRKGDVVIYITTPHDQSGLFSVHCEMTDNMIGCFPTYLIALDYKSYLLDCLNQ